MSQDIVFGIDLGTTYSCVSYVNEYDKAETLENMEGNSTTPSVIWFESAGSQVVGDEAKTYAITDPNNSVSFIKREMGKPYRRKIQGIEYSPEELSSKILTKLVNDANDQLRQKGVISEEDSVKRVVITCPAYFGLAEKEATKKAGELAGLEVLDIINEPTAAAISYGVIKGKDSAKTRMLIYDLGGGTFDVTVIDIDGSNINVVCTGGDPRLGGKDWDDATVHYLQEKWQDATGREDDILDDPETRSQMMESAEKAKKSLTGREKTIVNVSYDGDSARIELTRDEFDRYTNALLAKTVALTDICIEEMKKKDSTPIDGILLVGGSSYMPQVRKKLEAQYGIKVSLFDPNQAVAQGAAVYAKNLMGVLSNGEAASTVGGEIGKLTISNVSSRTYGIRCRNSQTKLLMIQNIIFQNDPLPVSKTEVFATMEPNQGGVDLPMYEMFGTDPEITDPAKVEAMQPVTTFEMRFKSPVPVATRIHVTLTLENSGLITLHAVEDYGNSELSATYNVQGGLSGNELVAASERTKNSTVQ